MTIRNIISWGDERLKQYNKPITNWTHELTQLTIDLFETAANNNGIGLAAPQVGINIRLAIVDLSCGNNINNQIILINPKIIFQSGSNINSEGCLSIPNIYEIVTRPEKIIVMTQTKNLSYKTLYVEGLLARTICHEIDHLNGVLFIDNFGPIKQQIIRRRYNKNKKYIIK